MFEIIVYNRTKNSNNTYFIYDIDEQVIIYPGIAAYNISKPSCYSVELADNRMIFRNTKKVIVNSEKLEKFGNDFQRGIKTEFALPFGYELTDEEYMVLEKYYIEQVATCIYDENFEEKNKIKKDIQKVKKLVISK